MDTQPSQPAKRGARREPQAPSRNIISVSRRTDIPAFYLDWFLNRLQASFVEYFHPFLHQRLSVSLRPENVSAFVFWSKNFGPLLPHLPTLSKQGFHFYCHFTVTGLPSYLEPNVPPAEETIRQSKAIASLFSPHHLQWRFDPIFLSQEITPEATLHRFSSLAQALEGSTHRCYTSFAIPYPKVLYRLKQANTSLQEPNLEQKQEIMVAMAQIASQHGIQLYSCCEDALVTPALSPTTRSEECAVSSAHNAPPTTHYPAPSTHIPTHSHTYSPVLKARCVDPEILASIGASPPSDLRPAPTREQCGCFKSFDIGAYDTCPHLCLYCYANTSPHKVHRNLSHHNPSHPSLVTADTRR